MQCSFSAKKAEKKLIHGSSRQQESDQEILKMDEAEDASLMEKSNFILCAK